MFSFCEGGGGGLGSRAFLWFCWVWAKSIEVGDRMWPRSKALQSIEEKNH